MRSSSYITRRHYAPHQRGVAGTDASCADWRLWNCGPRRLGRESAEVGSRFRAYDVENVRSFVPLYTNLPPAGGCAAWNPPLVWAYECLPTGSAQSEDAAGIPAHEHPSRWPPAGGPRSFAIPRSKGADRSPEEDGTGHSTRSGTSVAAAASQSGPGFHLATTSVAIVTCMRR